MPTLGFLGMEEPGVTLEFAIHWFSTMLPLTWP